MPDYGVDWSLKCHTITICESAGGEGCTVNTTMRKAQWQP